MTINELLKKAIARLDDQGGSESTQLDAELLLMRVLECPHSFLMAWPDKTLSPESRDEFDALLAEREQGKPIALILGEQEFWSLSLTVNEHTLIPRPDTECLVDYVLEHYDTHEALTVWDAGTGTGAIALAFAKEKPGWSVYASDKSLDALAVAKKNQTDLQLGVSFVRADWLTPLAANSLDILISNPPYIRENDPHLTALTFEPVSALVAENQGLACIQILAKQGRATLRKSGLLIVEHGYDQSAVVQDIFHSSGFNAVSTHKDYGKNDRFTVGIRP